MAAGSILFAYLLWAAAPSNGPSPLLVRAVVDGPGSACPSARQGSITIDMTARINPNPVNFPVSVCEAVVAPGATLSLAPPGGGSPVSLPLVNVDPKVVAIVGDTGCRGGDKQDCTDPKAWPFAQIAQQIADAGPDLIVHVGDYRYGGQGGSMSVDGQKLAVYDGCSSETPYTTWNAPDSPSPDNWQAWSGEFFTPAEPALKEAAWVVTRGNHELCSRSGPGWHYFLDPGTRLLDRSYSQETCQGAAPPSGYDTSSPYALALGRLRMVMMDTAAACDTPDASAAKIYAGQMKTVETLSGSAPAWLVSHRPVWGVKKLKGKPEDVINATLQQSVRAIGGSLPSTVQLILSGHIHHYESLAFSSQAMRPAQLILGNGGVELSGDKLPESFKTTVDGQEAHGTSSSEFGYMLLTLGKKGTWSGTVYDRKGTGKSAIATCAEPFDKAKEFCAIK